MGNVRVIISDFGGVLTNPLEEAFLAYQAESGIPLEELGKAMFTIGERDGENPLYALEKGIVSESQFVEDMQTQLRLQLGGHVEFTNFSDSYFSHLRPNQPFLDYLFEYKASGGRLALLTNNVKEWEPRWRAMLPIDELFETVIDSGFVGTRKPEPEIFKITFDRLRQLQGLDNLAASECVLVDDIELNCDAAIAFGFQAIRFEASNPDIISQVRAAVGRR